MRRFRLASPSPALVVAMIGLVVALGGTSYAAFNAPNNSVGSSQLKNGSVGAFKLKNNAVGTFKLKNNAVTNTKLGNGAVTASKIANGAIGAAALNLAGLGTVPSATNANHATTADTATNATNATNSNHATSADTAGSAPPLAYADFADDGTIQRHTTPSNLSASNIDHVSTGIWCLKNLSFTPKTAMVSADNSFGEAFTIASVVVVDDPTSLSGCNPGETVRVLTVNVPTGDTYAPPALADRSFNIWLN